MTELKLRRLNDRRKHNKTYVKVCKACKRKFLASNPKLLYCCGEHMGKSLCVECGVNLTKRGDGRCWDCSHISLEEFKKRLEKRRKKN